ncbi:hypothetical protein LXL04_020086 [Taraxacum kok-saghyz]
MYLKIKINFRVDSGSNSQNFTPTIRKVSHIEKKNLKDLLKSIPMISVTTDMWKSTNKKIVYMIHIGICRSVRVLSFVHLPPPHCGFKISDNLYKCLKDSGIENKIFTI